MSWSDIAAWTVEGLAASGLLMAIVWLIRPAVARQFGARVTYMLWALPLLRMVMPPLPHGTEAVAALPTPLVPAHDYIAAQFVPAAMPLASSASAPFPWLEAAIMIWAAGAIAFLLFQTGGYWTFRRMMLRDGIVTGREGKVTILETSHATGPLAFGVLSKYIVLPVDFADRFDADERKMALAHELAHHKRGDLLANMIALGLLGLHWCNPMAWIAYRAFRADQELACDAHVLGRAGQGQYAPNAAAYGRAILKAASGRHFAAACHLTAVESLKGRLKMLSTHAHSLRRISWGMTAVAITIATGLALTASGSRAAQQMAQVSKTVGGADLIKLASFLPQPSAAHGDDSADDWADSAEAMQAEAAAPSSDTDGASRAVASATPAPMAVPNASAVPGASTYSVPPVTPLSPMPPAAPLSAPMAPPAPPAPGYGSGYYGAKGHAPSAAEIRRMVPNVMVDTNCAGGGSAYSQTTDRVDASGRRQITVRVCGKAIAADARRAAEAARQDGWAARAEGDRAKAEAAREAASARREAELDRAEALREAAQARAEAQREAQQARAEALREGQLARVRAQSDAQVARASALSEMMQARRDIARDNDMNEATRAKALADLDKQIARMKERVGD